MTIIKDVCGTIDIDDINSRCPICQNPGQKVNKITVQSLIKEENIDLANTDYFICLSKDCSVSYFSSDGNYFSKDYLKVPIWFKEKSPVTICYCKEVTDEVILEHIKRGCCSTITEIKNHTGAQTGRDCLTKNPTGR